MNADLFFREASRTYDRANAGTLQWILDRPALQEVFLNTKVNSISGADYTDRDGRRGPDWLYGWIQGRGLEALCTHAAYFEKIQPNLSQQLNQRSLTLYQAICQLTAPSGHAYFCYDKQMRPVWQMDTLKNLPDPTIYTYSDAFCAKGLVAASANHDRIRLIFHLNYLDRVIEAVDQGFFQMDESLPPTIDALSRQKKSFGPLMILLGASGLLKSIGQHHSTAYADKFIEKILSRHLDLKTYLLRDVEDEDECNPGHAIEFVGFALEHLPTGCDPNLVATLEKILLASFAYGFKGPGICLQLSIRNGQSLSPYCPWWSLPETIRAAALVFERTHNSKVLEVWKKAHQAFFEVYWIEKMSFAYQTMTDKGPVDFCPATPDLDPGYHTGLSLFCASKIAARL